jgi:hypothetical protein
MFSLQGYVTEQPFSVTTLLTDRSLGNSGLLRNKKIVISIEPNKQSFVLGIQGGEHR